MGIAQMGGEPVVVEVGGKEWKISRMRLRHMARAASHIRDMRLQTLLRAQNDMPREVLSRAIGFAVAQDPVDEDVWSYLGGSDGTRYMMGILLRENHPTATEDDVDTVLGAGVLAAVMSASGMTPPEELAQPEVEDATRDRPLVTFGTPPAHPPTGQQFSAT